MWVWVCIELKKKTKQNLIGGGDIIVYRTTKKKMCTVGQGRLFWMISVVCYFFFGVRQKI